MCFFFFFNDTATTEIYTLSLHDALPILHFARTSRPKAREQPLLRNRVLNKIRDRKSTRLNSSHSQISYAVFCLKKKKTFNSNCAPANTITSIPLTPHPLPCISPATHSST